MERLWNTCQDRLDFDELSRVVKELRLARARTIEQANAVLEKFERWFNCRGTNRPAGENDAHRAIEKLDLEAILSIQQERVVMNDYTIRFENQAGGSN